MNVRVEVLAVELGDEGVKPLVISLNGDGGEEGLDVLSGGGGLWNGREGRRGVGRPSEIPCAESLGRSCRGS